MKKYHSNCYSYHLIFSKQNVSLIIHREDQFLDSSTSTSLSIYTTESFRTKVSYQQFIGLPTTGSSGDATQGQWKKACSNEINFDECIYREKESMMRNETKKNCTVPFTPDNKNVCNESDDMRTSFDIATRTLDYKYCLAPCKSLFISFGGKTMNDPKPSKKKKETKKPPTKNKMDNKMKINGQDGSVRKKKKQKQNDLYSSQYNAKLLFGTRVQKIEEHQLYKFINLVAESGKRVFRLVIK